MERNGVGKADGAAERGQEAAAPPERVPSPRQLSPCSGWGRAGGWEGSGALPLRLSPSLAGGSVAPEEAVQASPSVSLVG